MLLDKLGSALYGLLLVSICGCGSDQLQTDATSGTAGSTDPVELAPATAAANPFVDTSEPGGPVDPANPEAPGLTFIPGVDGTTENPAQPTINVIPAGTLSPFEVVDTMNPEDTTDTDTLEMLVTAAITGATGTPVTANAPVIASTPFMGNAPVIANTPATGGTPGSGNNRNDFVIEDTNVSGGGFQGDVTITADGRTVYSSADVSGIFKSTDGGLRFKSRNNGLESYKVASLAITPDNEQILYAGTGDKGSSAGLFRSVDGGNSWQITNAGRNAMFAGNHSAGSDPLPDGHPRSNGDLIAVDTGANAGTYTDDIVIAGSYSDGVRIFTQGGDTEAAAVLTSGFVRAIAHNAALPNIVYAGVHFADKSKSGIYKIDYSNRSSPSSSLEFRTPRPEGLTVLENGHVYGAISTAGIVKFDGSGWNLQNEGLSTDNPNRVWTAVTGYVSGNNDVVYAGLNNTGGNANGSNYSNIWRTVNGGDSWTPLVNAASNVDDTILGKNTQWWFRIDAFGPAGLGRSNSIVSSIDVARGPSAALATDDIIYVSGRGGIWKSDNGGDLWRPAVNNMQATANNGVATNPNNARQIALANTDYVVLETNASFTGSSVSRDRPSGSESKAYDALFDVVSDHLIIGVGDRDTNAPGGGEVYIKPSNNLGARSGLGWIDTDLASATASNNGRVRAVSYGYHTGSRTTSRIILAAVEGEGVFRYHNGNWSKSSGISIGTTKRSNFVWPNNRNSGVVYLLDLSSGLYRSNNGGQSWKNIWPSMSFRNNDFYNAGYIAAHDDNPTTLYLSIQGDNDSPIRRAFKVYRLTGADDKVFGAPGTAGITDITKHSGNAAIRRPGPLAFGPNGSLWLTEQQDSKNGISAALYYMANPEMNSSFTDATTGEYRSAAVSPSDVDVSIDGNIFISQNGLGVLKIAAPCQLMGSC